MVPVTSGLSGGYSVLTSGDAHNRPWRADCGRQRSPVGGVARCTWWAATGRFEPIAGVKPPPVTGVTLATTVALLRDAHNRPLRADCGRRCTWWAATGRVGPIAGVEPQLLTGVTLATTVALLRDAHNRPWRADCGRQRAAWAATGRGGPIAVASGRRRPRPRRSDRPNAATGRTQRRGAEAIDASAPRDPPGSWFDARGRSPPSPDGRSRAATR